MAENQVSTDEFNLNDVLTFDEADGHPNSRIVGIDRYKFDAEDGNTRFWNSFTLQAVDMTGLDETYNRWYAVDFPDLGLCFVQTIDPDDMPKELEVEPRLSGKATIQSEGDAEMGTGHADLRTFWYTAGKPPCMFAKEVFEGGGVLYFKNSALKGLVAVL